MFTSKDEEAQSSRSRASWRKIFLAFVPLAVATLFFFPVIFQGKTFYAFDILLHYSPWKTPATEFRAQNTLISDPINIFYPHAYHVKSSMLKGDFPLWNPDRFSGTPYTPPTHPLIYILLLLFPLTVAHDVLLWVHLWGTGLFMYLYLKEIGLHPSSSVIGAAAWMFNGYVMVWFEFENVPMMAFSFPLTLFFIELWFKRRTKANYLFMILAIALSISGNNSHLLIYQAIFVTFYCIWRFFSSSGLKKREDGPRWSEMGKLLCAVLLGAIVSTSFFTNHLSFLEDPQRTQFSFDSLFRFIGRLPSEYLLTLLFPDFYGSPALPLCFTPANTSYGNYNEICIYGGIPVLLLALTCVPYVRERFVAFYLITSLTAISMAMGSILYYPLAAYVPGLNMSTPTRILYVFGFSFSVLAALGNQMLLGRSDSRRKWAVALWFAVLVFAVMAGLYVQTDQGLLLATNSIRGLDHQKILTDMRDFFHPLSPILLKPLLLLGVSLYLLCAFLISKKKIFQMLLLVVLLYDLMSFGWLYNTASPKQLEYPETGGIRFLKEDPDPFRVVTFGSFLHNSMVPFGIQDAGGYSSFYPRRFGDFLHLSQRGLETPLPDQHSRWSFFSSFGSPLLDLINIKYLVTSPNVAIQSDKAELVYEDEVRIYRNKGVFQRAFFVPQYTVLENKEDVYRAIAGFTSEDFKQRVILESPPNFGPGEGAWGLKDHEQAAVKIVNYQADRIDIEVSSPGKGFVVIGDNFHPGWKAYVDGREGSVIRANYIMRAVPVVGGNHRITLVFKPSLILWGMLMSAVGWLSLLMVMGIYLFWRVSKKEKRKKELPVVGSCVP